VKGEETECVNYEQQAWNKKIQVGIKVRKKAKVNIGKSVK